MDQIKRAIQAIFTDCDVQELTPSTKLGDLPEWDSMNAVSFVMELERVTRTTLPNFLLGREKTLAEVHQDLRQRGAAL